MKQYPYIGKYQSTVKLFHTPTSFQPIESGHGFNRHEMNYTNITHEYLSSTWGVVESKEHAEFIVDLAELHGLKVWMPSDGLVRITHFIVFDGELMMHSHDCERAINAHKLKQITIPLPPKAEVNHSGKKLTPDEIKDFYNSDIHGSELPEAGHNLVFAASERKEWPCVGDEVLIDISNYDVVYGQNLDGLICKVSSIFKDGDTTVYAVNRDGVNYCFVRDLLQKPKTPEEVLRDDIKQEVFSHFVIFPELLDKRDTVISISECVSNALVSKYNITPKEV